MWYPLIFKNISAVTSAVRFISILKRMVFHYYYFGEIRGKLKTHPLALRIVSDSLASGLQDSSISGWVGTALEVINLS